MIVLASHAQVAELVDALGSGPSISNDVEVQVLSCVCKQVPWFSPGDFFFGDLPVATDAVQSA